MSSTGNWRIGLNLIEQYVYMLEHGLYTDCTFYVEDHEIGAHRVVVGRASPLFEVMLLRHEMTEEAKTGVVKITDISYQTFMVIVRYMYSEEFNIEKWDEICEVCLAADKYQLESLVTSCLEKLECVLTADNVWRILSLAEMFNRQTLIEQCVKSETLSCCTSDYFLAASEDQIVLLLSQETLNIDGDHTLVQLVERWARIQAECKGLSGCDEDIRDILLPRILPLLRLSTLNSEQFKICVKLVGWLSEEEKILLISKDARNFPQYLCTNLVPRNSEKFVHLRSQTVIMKSIHAIFQDSYLCAANLITNEDVLLHGLVVSTQVKFLNRDDAPIDSEPRTYDEIFTAKIYLPDGHATIKIEHEIEAEYYSTTTLKLPEPLMLQKNKKYNMLIRTVHSRGGYNATTNSSKEFLWDGIVITLSTNSDPGIGILESLIVSKECQQDF